MSPSNQLLLIGIMSERLRSEFEQDIPPIDMLALGRLGSESWKDLDVTTWLEQERVGWESQVRASLAMTLLP